MEQIPKNIRTVIVWHFIIAISGAAYALFQRWEAVVLVSGFSSMIFLLAAMRDKRDDSLKW